MVALELSQCLRIAYAGLLDASLIGLLFSKDTVVLENFAWSAEYGAARRLGQGLLQDLEHDRFDCVVVPLEDFAFYVYSKKTTELRVLGCLLGGDTRVIAEVDLPRSASEKRTLGAASPGCALMRFDDLSCANDFEFSCESTWVPHDQLLDAIQEQKFDFLELNSFWEALVGLRLGMLRRTFKMQDYGVPHSRSHMLIIKDKGTSVSRQLYTALRSRLLDTYEEVLDDNEKSARKLSALVDANHPICSQARLSELGASLRVLSPHVEEALITRLSLDWQELKGFYRWFYSKLGRAEQQWRGVNPVPLEHLVCDLWA